jgi:hypothetical protein
MRNNQRALAVFAGILTMLLVVFCSVHVASAAESPERTTLQNHEEIPEPPNVYTAPRTLRLPREMALYAVIAVGILALILLLVPRAVVHPSRISIVPLARPLDSVQDVSEYMTRTTRALMALGFLPQLDFTIPELPHRGFFRFMSMPNGHHTVLLAEIEAQPKTDRKANKDLVAYLEFQTILDNGCKINTNNSPMASPLTPPPHFLVTRHSHVVNPDTLFRIHREDVDLMRSARGGRIMPQSLEQFYTDFPEEWQDISEYQVSLGLMKRGKDPQKYTARPALLLRAMSPRMVKRPRVWWSVPVPLVGAVVTAVVVVAVPRLVAFLGLADHPVPARELEAYLILIPAAVAGYVVGTGGALLGLTCYAPTLVMFSEGPVAHVILLFLAMAAGSVGEKSRNRPREDTRPFYRYFSPEIYIVALLLILAAL